MSLDISRAEPGATPETLKATETVLALLQGFPVRLGLSVLTNSVAMLLCALSKSETAALDQSRHFCREVDRAIRKNFPHFKKDQSQ